MFSCPPILIVFFNRPDVLKSTISKLSEFAPPRIYLASDGPRLNHFNDQYLINECWGVVEDCIDWPCEVVTLVSTKNYGCDGWVPKAISWFFDNVESGIILEDDCLIDGNFIRFANEMLNKYRCQSKVMNISAANFQPKIRGNGDYYFSLYPANWAWATWARAWKFYDENLNSADDLIKSKKLHHILEDFEQRKYWRRFYHALRINKYSYWDAKWLLSIWANHGFSITPNFNLVSNVGFGKNATHTKIKSDEHCRQIQNLPEKIKDPDPMYVINKHADRYLFRNRYKPRLLPILKNKLLRIFGKGAVL